MRTAGIDIGTRTVKLVILDDGAVAHRRVLPAGHDPLQTCQELLDGAEFDRIVATGYGRNLFVHYLGGESITEVRAAALGARHLVPDCRTVLDIGGQVTKVVALEPDGGLARFEVNDRCAAGTGRFLEATAAALALSLPDFIDAAQEAEAPKRIEAPCTVFAESEVIVHAARGVPKGALALGLHQGVAGIAVGLMQTVPVEGPVVFCGGVALNRCVRELVELGLRRDVVVPPDPQIVAALGCALS